MKHECDINGESSASAQQCICGRRWLKQDNGDWRMENRADRRASLRGYRQLRRTQQRRQETYVAAVAKVAATRRGWKAKRARQAAAAARAKEAA